MAACDLFWLSYGGGVNSSALAVLLCEGKLPQFTPWRCVWADTQDEEDETYDYVFGSMMPYLRRHGVTLEVCRPYEGVIERLERLKVTGSRINRACTDHGKQRPLKRHVAAHSPPGLTVGRLIGIDAAESHRAQTDKPTEFYPLVEMDIDRDECIRIIGAAGLPVPPKSGCWHCQFQRVGSVLKMANERPERMKRIIRLEQVAADERGQHLCQWNDTPAIDYAKRACASKSSGPLFQEVDPDLPCGCFDG